MSSDTDDLDDSDDESSSSMDESSEEHSDDELSSENDNEDEDHKQMETNDPISVSYRSQQEFLDNYHNHNHNHTIPIDEDMDISSDDMSADDNVLLGNNVITPIDKDEANAESVQCSGRRHRSGRTF